MWQMACGVLVVALAIAVAVALVFALKTPKFECPAIECPMCKIPDPKTTCVAADKSMIVPPSGQNDKQFCILGDKLSLPTQLQAGDVLRSKNGAYYAVLQYGLFSLSDPCRCIVCCLRFEIQLSHLLCVCRRQPRRICVERFPTPKQRLAQRHLAAWSLRHFKNPDHRSCVALRRRWQRALESRRELDQREGLLDHSHAFGPGAARQWRACHLGHRPQIE